MYASRSCSCVSTSSAGSRCCISSSCMASDFLPHRERVYPGNLRRGVRGQRYVSGVEAVERKALWLALPIGLVLVWSGIGPNLGLGVDTWQLVVFLTSLFCQVAAAALIVAAAAPTAYVRADLARREQLLFFALTLFCIGLALLAVNEARFAYNVHSHTRSFGG